jgi:hypothetical protein
MSIDPVEFTETNPVSFNRYAYANNSPYAFYDPDGNSAVTFIGGVIYESAQALQGNGFNSSNLAGALVDGYNGEGDGFASAAVGDALTFAGGAVGALAKAAKIGKAAQGAKSGHTLTKSAEKGISSLEKRIAEHEKKLADFKNNPTVRPGMEGQSEATIKAAQESRIRHLNKEIQTFKENIKKLKGDK